jgi:hypothetical protein
MNSATRSAMSAYSRAWWNDEKRVLWRLVALCYRNNMPQPVKLSDAIILDARIAAESQQRSIAGQVEFWASLGKSIELLLNGKQVQALRESETAKRLANAIATVETAAGRARVAAVLANRPYPHFKQVNGRPELLIRIDENGTQTVGRFVNRAFVAEKGLNKAKSSVAKTAIGPSSGAGRRKSATVQPVGKHARAKVL